jgi:hypothetical protein
MQIELVYFDAHGRGEVTRLCYAAAGRGDELLDTRLPLFCESDLALTTWLEKHKPACPFGHVPYLNVRDSAAGSARQVYGDGVMEVFVSRHLGLLGDSMASEGLCGTIAVGAASILSDDLIRAGLHGDAKVVREAVSPSQPVGAVLAYLEHYIKGAERDYIVDERITLADLAIFNVIDALVMGPRGNREVEGLHETLCMEFPALMHTFAVVSRDLKLYFQQRQLRWSASTSTSEYTEEPALQSSLLAKGGLPSDKRAVSFGATAAAAAAAAAVAIRGAARSHPLAQTLSIQEETRKQASARQLQLEQDTRWEANCRHVADASLWREQQKSDVSSCTIDAEDHTAHLEDESWMQPIETRTRRHSDEAISEPNARNKKSGGNFAFSAIIGATRAHPLAQTLALQDGARKQLAQRKMQMQEKTRWEANCRHVDASQSQRRSRRASTEDAADSEPASVSAHREEDSQVAPCSAEPDASAPLVEGGVVGLVGSFNGIPMDPLPAKSPAKSLSLMESIRRRSEGDGSQRGLLASMAGKFSAAKSSLSDLKSPRKECPEDAWRTAE